MEQEELRLFKQTGIQNYRLAKVFPPEAKNDINCQRNLQVFASDCYVTLQSGRAKKKTCCLILYGGN